MTLAQFITADQNSLFTIALALMLMIAVLEGVTTLIGMGISELVESIMPDFDMDVPTADTPNATLTKLLGWINFGKVPVLIIFICFLTAFSVVGYSIQYLIYGVSHLLVPQLLVVPVAFVLALPFVRMFTNLLQKIMPKDESSALSQESFVGALVTITLGTARKGSPAEAKTVDQYGQTHYFMVQPENEDESFVQGEEVLLLRPSSNGFYAIKNSNTSL